MPQSLDTVQVVEAFIPAKAEMHPIRETKYSQRNEYSAADGSLETYNCDAGCKNCHCATF
jgi:hypothetical protein